MSVPHRDHDESRRNPPPTWTTLHRLLDNRFDLDLAIAAETDLEILDALGRQHAANEAAIAEALRHLEARRRG